MEAARRHSGDEQDVILWRVGVFFLPFPTERPGWTQRTVIIIILLICDGLGWVHDCCCLEASPGTSLIQTQLLPGGRSGPRSEVGSWDSETSGDLRKSPSYPGKGHLV